MCTFPPWHLGKQIETNIQILQIYNKQKQVHRWHRYINRSNSFSAPPNWSSYDTTLRHRGWWPPSPKRIRLRSTPWSSQFSKWAQKPNKHQQFQWSGSFQNCHEIYLPLSWLECYIIPLPLSCAFFLLDHLGHVHGPCNQSSAFDPSKVGPVSIQYASHVTLFRQPALQCNLSNREVDKPGLKPGRLDGLGCEWEQETWQMALHKGDDPGFLGVHESAAKDAMSGIKTPK